MRLWWWQTCEVDGQKSQISRRSSHTFCFLPSRADHLEELTAFLLGLSDVKQTA